MTEAGVRDAIPAAWRVTLSWPVPAGWKTVNRLVAQQLKYPDEVTDLFGYLYASTVSDVGVATRKRSIIVSMTVPAEDPRPHHSAAGYTPSAAKAIAVAVSCARFGHAMLRRIDTDASLPEPVRIAAKPVAGLTGKGNDPSAEPATGETREGS